MGQAESSQASHDPSLSTNAAFHVLRVADHSPAAEAGLEPFFDFIVGAQGRQLGDEIDLLTDILEESEGSQISLQVYSTKRKQVRDVYVVPSTEWSAEGGGTGQVDGEPSLLGLSLRLCNPHHALEQVWHVLEVLEGSPAQSAGLVPFGDWIIGYAGGVLRGEGDFYDVVEAHTDKPLRLFVYNADYDVTREAILVPNRTWGGEGLLGAGVGYGLLHRIPKPQDQPRVASQHDQAASTRSAPQNPSQAAPPPVSSAKTAPPPQSRYIQPPPPPQSQQAPRSHPPPPPSASAPSTSLPHRNSDTLSSLSSPPRANPAKNPLYASPPPRSQNPLSPPPRTSPGGPTTAPRPHPPPPPPPLGGSAVASPPPPTRRTAAIETTNGRSPNRNPNPTGSRTYVLPPPAPRSSISASSATPSMNANASSTSPRGPSATTYTSHPSFSYGGNRQASVSRSSVSSDRQLAPSTQFGPSAGSAPYETSLTFGEYDESEGVSVVPSATSPDDDGGTYGQTSPFRDYGGAGARGNAGAAQVIAEEADE
ncbi:hypothetical protein JCM10212_004520 [Sporobolomyces blumeae]